MSITLHPTLNIPISLDDFQRFAAKAAKQGKTPDALLAEIINREVGATPIKSAKREVAA